MYFMLGNIAFEPVNLTEFSEQHTAEFAEHAVLKANLVYKRWAKS